VEQTRSTRTMGCWSGVRGEGKGEGLQAQHAQPSNRAAGPHGT